MIMYEYMLLYVKSLSELIESTKIPELGKNQIRRIPVTQKNPKKKSTRHIPLVLRKQQVNLLIITRNAHVHIRCHVRNQHLLQRIGYHPYTALIDSEHFECQVTSLKLHPTEPRQTFTLRP